MTGLPRRTALQLAGTSFAGALAGCVGGTASSAFESPANGFGATPVEWTRTYENAHSDIGRSLVETPSGFAFYGETTTFETEETAEQSDAWFVATSPAGEERANRALGGDGIEEGIDIVADGDGFALLGWTSSFGAGESDFWLVSVDSNGDERRSNTYGGERYDYPSALLRTDDGGFLLGGRTGTDPDGAWVVKTDDSGTAEWHRRYKYSGSDVASAVQTADGGYVLVGTTRTSSETAYAWAKKLDADGDVGWTRSFRTDDGNQSVHAVESAADGGVLVSGGTVFFARRTSRAWARKLDSSGDTVWKATDADRYRTRVMADDEGGSVTATSEDGGVVLVERDERGEERRRRRVSVEFDLLRDAALTADGGAALLGTKNVGSLGDYGLTDAVLVKIEAE
ncbi:hypothetical protein [Halopelagius fulvigenes]|uniref:Uncharacterized protein n=1 Tax=Halopelagius fulvigenes TaxID=1198324 RepID=A0ABD5U2S9_9EURY